MIGQTYVRVHICEGTKEQYSVIGEVLSQVGLNHWQIAECDYGHRTCPHIPRTIRVVPSAYFEECDWSPEAKR